jgi:antitoxin (DNA-binding transcriptional repressor) of toxin-antitoxin stability system
MERIGVRELRANLAASLRRAGAGERIVVTIDDRPVAQLGPLEPIDGHVTLADLAARGLVRLPHRADRPLPGAPVAIWAGIRLDQLVAEVRR